MTGNTRASESASARNGQRHREASRLDDADVLAAFKQHFVINDSDLIYLDGNSLGRLPTRATAHLETVVLEQWGDRLIRSWNEGWWDLQIRLGDMLAPVVGAHPGEVMISDATTVNLFKLAHAAVASRHGPAKIVTDDLNFPTDLYALSSVAARFDDVEVVIVGSDGIHGPIDGLRKAIDKETVLVALSHTVFRSGFTYDLAEMTAIAHAAGALTLWDTSHSVGAMPIGLAAADADMAVGCTYKYLNGGPGAPAFLYVRSDLQKTLSNPIAGWWGHESPFSFEVGFRPTDGIRKFHTGTMPILSLAAMEIGLSEVIEAGIDRIRAKSVALGEFFLELFYEELDPIGFELRSPVDSTNRGAHVALGHQEAWPIARALVEKLNVIPDFRAPDNLRFGLSPLYTSFGDLATAVGRIRRVVDEQIYEEFRDADVQVT